MKKKFVYWCACWALIFIVVPLSAAAAEQPVGVAYRGHIQDRGDYPLDGSWVDSPEIIGTVGQSKRIEGFEIKLTGETADTMELRYNVHVQNRGWLYDENDPTDWPRDGAYAGTRGESLRIEAVKIVLTDSAGKPVPGYSVEYRGHVQNVGDQPQAADCWLADGAQLGTVGSSLRLEALLVKVVKNNADLTAYNALVAKIAKLNEDDFTAESWGALQTAITEHVVTANLPQIEVDAAVAAIQAAYEGLKNEPTVYAKTGTYGPASGSQTINGDVTVDGDGVILQNLVITGDLLISEAVGNGTVTLNNVTVDGDTLVRGGGANSIHINGGSYSRIVMEKTASGAVRIVAKDVDGLDVVIAEDATGETIILEGAFDSVEVNAPNMTVTTQGNTTTIGKMTVGEAGAGSTVTVNPGTTVSDLVLDGKAAVKGQGTVVKAEVNADGAVFDKKPGSYTVEPGVVIPPVFPTPDNGGGSGGGYTPPGPVAVTGVSLDKTASTLAVNDVDTLAATVAPAAASNKALSWSSSDETIATVNSSGKVTALSEGQATITVTTQDGHKSATCVVTVKDLQQTIAGITVPFAGESPVTAITATSQFSGTVSWQKKDGSNLTPLAVGEKFVGTSSYLATINLTMKAPYSAADIPANFFAVAGATATNDAGSLVITAEFLPTDQYKTTELGVITAYSGPGGNVTVPETVNGIAVTGIGANAFKGQTNVTSVSIPQTVTSIGNGAFMECSNMTSLTFAGTSQLTAIGDKAFQGCQKLESVSLPASVKTIGASGFLQCLALKDLNLGSVEIIGANAFYECTKLVNLTIPNTVASIGSQAFRACTSLKTVHFIGGSNPQYLFGYTFSGCTALETVTFEDNSKATFPYWGIFAGCGKLTSVTLPPGLTKIPSFTFESCTALTSLTIPATVTTIEVDAFANCPANLVLRFDGNAPSSVFSPFFSPGTTFAYWDGKTGFTGDPWENSAFHLVLRNASLSQTAVTINSASFSFDAQTDATAVELQQKTVGGDWTPATTAPLNESSDAATATGLTPNTSYDFRLLITGGDNPGPSIVVNLNTLVAVTGITLNKPSLELSANGSETLTATVEPADAANRNLNWTTSNTAVATVNTDTGEVTAVGAGAATITATAADGGGADAFCTVTVLPYKTSGTTELTITEYGGSATTVSIPETIGGNPVVAIGKEAFYNNKTLTEVTIPATVTRIGVGAFHNCNNLITVHFSDGSQLIGIDLDGFSECPLTSLTLPSQLRVISNYSFYNNCLSGSLTIPATVTYIGENAFEGKMKDSTHLSSLETLTIQSSDGVIIRPLAFKNQPLTTITLPTGAGIYGDATTMGTNGTGFLLAYLLNDAGTYTYNSGTATWSK
ncbi:leucine-rich repeat protein [Acetobacterium wieringae]|uniref:leucine-rich repeat protein n=1 Tax=Acetobacterium wieringae TaxID=52694 RepID=UPI0026EA6C5B|nr:leucine-rich repeat protein [Acetobacterium wieringae]